MKYLPVSGIMFAIIGLLWFYSLSVEAYTCKMYGECYYDDDRQHWLNCAVNHTAKDLRNETKWTDDVIALLVKRCPHLVDKGRDSVTCCAPEQVRRLDESLKMAEGVIGRCPTCMKNFVNHICGFTCGPDQSRFGTVQEEENPETGKMFARKYTVQLADEYMWKTYNSCNQVVMPQSGNLAMDLLCGVHGAADCTPQKWFDYMGDADTNPFVPFKIQFVASTDELALNPTSLTCDTAYEGLFACSCVDCKGSCPTGTEPPYPEEPCEVLGADCVSFSVGVALFVFLTGCFIGISVGIKIKGRRSTKPSYADTFDIKDEQFENNRRCTYNKINIFLEKLFYGIGYGCASQPVLVLMVTSWVVLGLCYGILFLEVTTDPVDIWSSPNSEVREQKNFFDQRFGPFYRTSQVFIQAKGLPSINTTSKVYGPAFNKKLLLDIVEMQKDILKIGIDEDAGLDKVCFAPLRSPFTGPNTLQQCAIMSFFGYFGDDVDRLNTTGMEYLSVIQDCIGNPYNPECLAPWGGGIESRLVFGGGSTPAVEDSDTVVMTILINNHLNQEDLQPALEWEKKFIAFMKNYDAKVKPSYMDLSFSSERSIEDELERVSQAEIGTAIISYLVMFVYIAVSLGNIQSLKTILLDSKITLGIVGILIVLSSVGCSLGFFGYIGVPTTLLIIEVIPFLVLAIGVDNIFILVSGYNDICIALQEGKLEYPDKDKTNRRSFILGKTLGKVGPSMILTTTSQCACFAIGTLSGMPAVNRFALYATLALFLDFIFQITAFVAFLSLDNDRFRAGRLDVLCCVKQSQCTGEKEHKYSKGILHAAFKKFYAPVLFHWLVMPIVAVVFVGWLCWSISVIPSIEIGLEQDLAMPRDSFVRKYLLSVGSLLQMGPPVYWVLTKGLNFSDVEHQNLICGGQLCNNNSMLTQLYIASQYTDRTYLQRTPNSWLDDFFDWGLSESCCQYFYSNNSFCPHEETNSSLCGVCNVDMEYFNVRPSAEAFEKYLPYFLQDNPSASCAKGGHASYGPGLNYIMDNQGNAKAQESFFMGYHKTLRGSKDFYEAYRYAKNLAKDITTSLREATGDEEITVFPYSVFYVFYEQYLTMWPDALESLGYSLLVVFVVSFVLTGLDIFSAVIILLSVAMILVDMLGLMYAWEISLNAVSLVNLVMCVGIAVEFCSHIVHTFATSTSKPEARVFDALVDMGSNVLSGITLTKFAGIVVLAFSESELFKIFYFRMFLCIVLVGAAHGLIFLPVFLQYLTFVGSLCKPNKK